MSLTPISLCRVCKANLNSLLNLGEIPISGAFRNTGETVPTLPLEFSKCESCNLHQLMHSLPIEELYGEDYGYESHLNDQMVKHLEFVANKVIQEFNSLNVNVSPKTVLDIASNDGTLLEKFNELDQGISLIGVDPLIEKFENRYPSAAKKMKVFFGPAIQNQIGRVRIDIVTSLSVFYDLDDPIGFAQTVYNILDKDGIWHLEQSYLVSMIEKNSFDTICHEHLLYLSAGDFLKIFEMVGFRVFSCELNDTNGGSISISVVKKEKINSHCDDFRQLVDNERNLLYRSSFVQNFLGRIVQLKTELPVLLKKYRDEGYDVVGLGASTKGNILLNFFGLDSQVLSKIGEVNPKKIGKVTPGTNIPIVSENEILIDPSEKQVILILPWHFRQTFENKTKDRVARGDKVVFPLPSIEVLE